MDKILICYFSATGVTKDVSEKIADTIGADLFEIKPEVKYTEADLDWHNKQSRSSIEMEDKTSRPTIKNKIVNLKEYSKIIIGFPVWWYTAPTIINTFIEENDLIGKNIYIFVTSGSSDYKESFNDLKNTYSNLKFIRGIRFSNDISYEKINNFIS